MATENSVSNASSVADSYVGSLISLTSKSEIRYEGVLYNINTYESSIGLRNVRSFGTEGRRKEGPQVPPSGKEYEFILFRGSDIKDLEVKSSPPAQPTPPVNIDPAIIQSHYPRPISTHSSLPSDVSGSLADPSSHNAQSVVPGSSFLGGPPLYQPGGTLGSWGAAPPPPNANGSGPAMPLYWQGYYGPPSGLPQSHQQSILSPQPGMSMPPSMQQPLQYHSYSTPVPVGPSKFPGSNLMETPYSFLPITFNPSTLTSTFPSSISSSLPPFPASTLASESLSGRLPNKAPNNLLPTASPSFSMPSVSTPTTSITEIKATIPPISSKPNAVSGPTLFYQSTSQSTTTVVETSNSVQLEAPISPLVTPGQLLQFGSSAPPLAQPGQSAYKDKELVPESSSSTVSDKSVLATTESQPPILPLPVPSRTAEKPNGDHFQARHGYRGRGRGRERGRGSWSSRPVTQFTEDFDFIAMNDKFKKDEVWGLLGKGNKSHLNEQVGENFDADFEDEDEDDVGIPKFETVYNKDDFFDSISCNSLGHELQNGRTRFSEQMKMDTETFGEFSRYQGGRWPNRGGRFHGGYYGRGGGGCGGGYYGRGDGRGGGGYYGRGDGRGGGGYYGRGDGRGGGGYYGRGDGRGRGGGYYGRGRD